jgi:tripeptidyl-peptidase-2
VLVAIFDTGCDPGASGLQRTSDGKPKYVDFFDCSGSGDIDTSASVVTAGLEATKSGADGGVQLVSPVTQRTLTVPASFVARNPSGRWQVGVKRAFDLYPSPLVERVRRERKKLFDERQRLLEQSLLERLASWDEDAKRAASESPAAASTDTAGESSLAGSFPPSFTAKDKADLEARLAEVRAVGAKYDDVGPVFDILVWHDGSSSTNTDNKTSGSPSSLAATPKSPSETTNKNGEGRERGWWVAVDSTGTGDFTSARALTNYIHGGEYGVLDGVSLMNYTVNIYNSGQLVSLVTTVGSHGTHVAGIVAANESVPDGLGADHNGLAPGAQLLSLRIGDGRLGSMETGVGLARGIIEAIRAKVDVINMRYGNKKTNRPAGDRRKRMCLVARILMFSFLSCFFLLLCFSFFKLWRSVQHSEQRSHL